MEDIQPLQLEEDKDYSTTLYRIEKGWTIRFALGSSLQGIDVQLFCNHPTTSEVEFDEKKFNELSWLTQTEYSLDLVDLYSDLKIHKAGVFKFYLEKNLHGKKTCICQGTFIVDPVLKLNCNQLHLDSIILQTVLTKCLGPFSQWKKRLQVAYETGYNMIHFTPIQELGSSNSSYSLKDHMKFCPSSSDGEAELTETALKKFINKIRQEWNMLSIIDVVWNHCANNCEWILKHPNAAYNLKNSPHLRPAFLVDRTLWYLNKDIMKGKLINNGILKSITTEQEMDFIRIALRKRLKLLRLCEFFQVDLKSELQQFMDADETCMKKEATPKIIQDPSYRRFGCHVNIDEIAHLCYMESNGIPTDKDTACRNFQKIIEKLNVEKATYVAKLEEKIIHNTAGHIRYHFLDDNGPKYGCVTEEHSIATRYFSYPFKDTSIENDALLVDNDDAALIMAHNGWVMGGDALKNFAESDSSVYLCRELVAWGDSIKLRYGLKPDDSPYLWNLMKEYTEQMARIFHGFRLDNCHGTPIHVAEYLVSCARAINPDLYVIAELFTNSEESDNTFINRLGINSLIRENMGASSPRDLGRHVHRFGGDAVGSFLKTSQPLRPSMAHAIFMDVTHDNPSLFESRTVFDILPSAALVLATTSGAGSSRGYDELVPHHIHVVAENRLYQSWSPSSSCNGDVSMNQGILNAKKFLNKLHQDMRSNGFTQIYVDQATEEIAFM